MAGIVDVDGRPAFAIRHTAASIEGAANKALIAFLTSPAVKQALTANGFEPR